MKDSYSGGCFLPGPENKRKIGKVNLENRQIILVTNDETYNLDVSKVKIKVGGASDRIVFFSEKDDGLVLYSNDLEILEDTFWDKFEETKNQIEFWKKKKKSSRNAFFLGIIIFFLLTFLIFNSLGGLKRMVIKAIPLKTERKIGDLLIGNMKKSGEIVNNEKLTKDINKLLEFFDPRVIRERDEMTLHLSRNGQVNAFALPGGHIVINFGLISKSKRVEEVLGVLAHEMAHVTQRHILNNILDSLGLFSVVQLLVGDFSGVAAVILTKGQFLLQKKFSRSFEEEADRVGFHYLISSGLDPSGLKDFFQFLKKESKIENSKAISFLSTHPLYEERIKQMDQLFKEANPSQLKKIKIVSYDFDKLKKEVSQGLLSP